MNKFGLTKELVLEIVQETAKRMKLLKEKFIDEYDVHMSNKNISEILSKVMEKVAADIMSRVLGYSVIKAKSDRESDLIFTQINRPLEIKVTSTDNAWTGGEFSQRPSDYLLVSWGENFNEFFVALAHLDKREWTSHFKQRFYGSSLTAKKLFNKSDKELFIGGFNERCTKLVRERI